MRWPTFDDRGEAARETRAVVGGQGPLLVGQERVGENAVTGSGDFDQKVDRLGVLERNQSRDRGGALPLPLGHPRRMPDEQPEHPHGLDLMGVEPDELDPQPIGPGQQALGRPRRRLVVDLRPGLGSRLSKRFAQRTGAIPKRTALGLVNPLDRNVASL